jgi:rod shape-determining protein MreC
MLLAVTCAIALLIIDSHQPSPLKPMRDGLYEIIEPLFYGLAWPSQSIEDVANNLRFGLQLQTENEQLRQENLLLRSQVQKLSFLASDNARLRGLHSAASVLNSRVLISEVIGIDPDPDRHVLIINRGRNQGLYEGQAVLDAKGMFGRVIQPGKITSRIMLITDRSHSVPVRINRNGIRAILSGTGSRSELRLQYVSEKSDIAVGDLLVTSGLGLDFPEGYPVAKVTSINRQADDQFLSITATPLAALDRSRYVLALFEKPVGAQYLIRPKDLEALAPLAPAATEAANAAAP